MLSSSSCSIIKCQYASAAAHALCQLLVHVGRRRAPLEQDMGLVFALAGMPFAAAMAGSSVCPEVTRYP